MFKETSLAHRVLTFNQIPTVEWPSLLRKDTQLHWPVPTWEKEIIAYFKGLYRDQELIYIHGDYDCDGLTGSTVLYQFLKSAGFRVRPFLPTRHLGYGLHKSSIDQFKAEGASCLITVDCGISNRAEIAYAASLGIETIITDHHDMPALLPEAKFTLHPRVLKIHECSYLAGVGVAYWLTHLLSPHFTNTFNAYQYIGLVAIGTIGDLTPLRGFNRQVVKHGLEALRLSPLDNFSALKKVTKINNLDEQALAFQIIPRLNAAGRLYTPMHSFALLNTPEPSNQAKMADRLEQINLKRKALGAVIEADILDQVGRDRDVSADCVIVEWTDHPHGMVGVTCSQLMERYRVPVFIMAREGERLKGSARSQDGTGFHCKQALDACSDALVAYGGHACAAGYEVEFGKFELFRQRMVAYARSLPKVAPRPRAMIVDPLDLTIEDVRGLEVLKPFGAGFPAPVFASQFTIHSPRLVGARKQHLIGTVGDHKVCNWNAGYAASTLAKGEYFLYEVAIDTYKGEERLQLTIRGKTKEIEA